MNALREGNGPENCGRAVNGRVGKMQNSLTAYPFSALNAHYLLVANIDIGKFMLLWANLQISTTFVI